LRSQIFCEEVSHGIEYIFL